MLKFIIALLLGTAIVGTPALSQNQFSNEELEELARQGFFKPQYVIPRQLETHPMIVLLKEHGLFDISAIENQLMLPVDRELAAQMGISRYAEIPLPSYLQGVQTQLDKYWTTAQAAGGNQAAFRQAADEVIDLQSILKAALINGNVWVSDK